MKILKVLLITVIAALFVAVLVDISVRLRAADAVRAQNRLLEKNIDTVAAQNKLLRENKMCLAFDQNRPDKLPPLVIPEN